MAKSLAEMNLHWWEKQLTMIERSIMAAEQAGDGFLLRAERYALSDAKKKFAASICNG